MLELGVGLLVLLAHICGRFSPMACVSLPHTVTFFEL